MSPAHHNYESCGGRQPLHTVNQISDGNPCPCSIGSLERYTGDMISADCEWRDRMKFHIDKEDCGDISKSMGDDSATWTQIRDHLLFYPVSSPMFTMDVVDVLNNHAS